MGDQFTFGDTAQNTLPQMIEYLKVTIICGTNFSL